MLRTKKLKLKAKLYQVIQSKFVRNVAIVATGTVAAQVITMVFLPIITRIYGPEAFGLLGVFTALFLIISPIVALSYPIAIVLPKDEQDAKGLAWLSFYITLLMSCLVAILFTLLGDWFLKLISSDEILPYIMLLPLSMFFAGLFQIAEQWLIRNKNFSLIAKIKIYRSLIVGSLQTGLGLFNPVGGVLIIVWVFGSAIQAFMLFIGAKKAIEKEENSLDESLIKPKKRLSKKSLKELALSYQDFLVYRTPQVFINAIAMSFPVLILVSFAGTSSAGFYSIAISALGVPALLLGKSVSDVFYPRITEAHHNGEDLWGLLVKASISLAVLGFIPFATVIVFGPWLFSLVFGHEWVTAGEYARWLSVWLFVSLAARPSITAIPILKLQALFLVYEILGAIFRLGSLLIGFIVFDSAIIAIAIYSVVGALMNIIIILITLYKSKSMKLGE